MLFALVEEDAPSSDDVDALLGKASGRRLLRPPSGSMKLASAHSAALRALLTGDDSTLDRLTSAATAEDETGLAALALASFLTAARERFTADWTAVDAIRFVAHVRTDNDCGDFSPGVAEALLVDALSGDKPYQAPEEDDSAYTQMVLLRALAAESNEPQLDRLIEESQRQADQWLASAQEGSAATVTTRDAPRIRSAGRR